MRQYQAQKSEGTETTEVTDTEFKGLLMGSSAAHQGVLSSCCAAGQVLCKARILAKGTFS